LPIRRMLQNESLEPQEVERLATAYDMALRALHLVDRNDPLTEIVARKIIEVARSGERDPASLSQIAVKQLGIP
jgi:hypothetical protein